MGTRARKKPDIVHRNVGRRAGHWRSNRLGLGTLSTDRPAPQGLVNTTPHATDGAVEVDGTFLDGRQRRTEGDRGSFRTPTPPPAAQLESPRGQ